MVHDEAIKMSGSLPNCSILSKCSPMVYRYALDELSAFIKGLIDADCWAIVVDGQELYNDYVKKSIKDRFLEKINRDCLLREDSSPSTFLLGFMKDIQDNHSLDIYMFHGPESYKCRIVYHHDIQSFVRSFWYTQAYFDKYGDDFETNFSQTAQ